MIVGMVVLGGRAGNIVRLGTASGQPGTAVSLTVSLEADEPVTAMELRVPLDKNLTYVEESARLQPEASAHSLKVTQVDGELRLFVYSLSLASLANGDLVTFDLRLGKVGAIYPLAPSVVLSNTSGQSLAATVESGSVTIQTPGISVQPAVIDYGRCAIRSSYEQAFTLQNTGTTDLHITGYEVSASVLRVTPESQTLPPGGRAVATVTYAPVERAASVSETIKVNSDATSGANTVEVKAIPFSVNELHVSSAEGVADEEVTVSLTMNNMEPIVGGEVTFRLPDALAFVDGSAECGSRSAGHQVLSSLDGNKLRLVFYNLSNSPVGGNDGELLRFRLRLNGRSGYNTLAPETVILSNGQGENMVSGVMSGCIRIAAPRISCPASLALGEGSVTETLQGQVVIRNNGNAPLVIENVTFLQDGFRVDTPLPLTIPNYGSAPLEIGYSHTSAGSFATQMNVYTNDPDARMVAVNVAGSLYEPNHLSFIGMPADDGASYTLGVALENYTDIVAIQFDVNWIPGMQASRDDILLSGRAANHTVSVADLGNGTTRVILLSMTNAPLTGNTGKLLTMVFRGQDFMGHPITINHIVLSNRKGENLLSPGHETVAIPVEEGFRSGDVNDDGVVDAVDVMLVVQYYLTKQASLNLPAADVVRDGVIDAKDIMQIQQINLKRSEQNVNE